MTDTGLKRYERHITTGLVWFRTQEECREWPTAPLAQKAQLAGTVRAPIYGQWMLPYGSGWMIETIIDHECINKGNEKLDFEKFVRSALGCYREFADSRRKLTDARKCDRHAVFFHPGCSTRVNAAYEPHRRREWLPRGTEQVEVQIAHTPAPQYVTIQTTKTETTTWQIPVGAAVDLLKTG